MEPKFILCDKLDIKDTIAKIETAIEHFPEEIKNKIRILSQEELIKIINREQTKDEADRKCLNEIRKNPDIACISTDKTGKLCLMEKDNYNKLMEEVIEKIEAKICTNNPINKLKEKTKELIKNGEWPENKVPIIKNHAPIIPRMFGKFKDHKDKPSLRPIVNRSEGPTSPLEKYMKNIYKELLPPSENSLTSNTEFIAKLKEIKVEPNDLLVSFDVVDLYPSIDLEETNNNIKDLILKKYGHNKISETLLRAHNLLINESFFQFNNLIYKQTKGVPMGSPISGILAELKLRNLENNFGSIKSQFKAYYRYVDDIFAIISRNTDPSNLLESLNNLDDKIKFTLEVEENKILNYLDVKIIRNDYSFETTVYRKPTKSNEVISNRANTPYSYKIAAFRSYINRAINICSNNNLLKQELNFIKEIAKNAGYRKNLIDKLYNKRIKQQNHINNAQPQPRKYTSGIPFIKNLSNKIKQQAAKINYYIPIKPNPNIFQRIRNDKNPTAPNETPGVYQIDYKSIEGQNNIYIGMTKRRISERYKEHIYDLKNNKNTTAIARENLKSAIDLSTISIKKIAPFHSQTYALTREAIEIASRQGQVCNEAGSVFLCPGWRRVLAATRSMRGGRRRETTVRQ